MARKNRKDGEAPMADEAIQPKLAQVDLDDIPEVSRQGKASRIVEEFLGSGMKAAKIEDGAKTFNVALKRYVKANSVPVEVVTRKGETYLRLTDEAEAEQPAFDES